VPTTGPPGRKLEEQTQRFFELSWDLSKDKSAYRHIRSKHKEITFYYAAVSRGAMTYLTHPAGEGSPLLDRRGGAKRRGGGSKEAFLWIHHPVCAK
jgi:hypothetical protein